MHLDVARKILGHAELDREIAAQLRQALPAFYLGNVAADFQTIADVPREETHFYPLPPDPDVRAHEKMLEEHPQLAHASTLRADHAVFVAAYRAHLMLDLCWFRHVLIPFFVEATDWPADHRQRFLVHNTLLTYLDKLALETLPPSTAETLAAADPDHWLPFAGDGDLIRWRDLLVKQLQPGATTETISIYAQRMKMTPEEFAANLEDPQWMHEHVFRKVPLDEVEEVLSQGTLQSIPLIADYLTQT